MKTSAVIGGIVTVAAGLAVIVLLRTSDSSDSGRGVKVGVGVGKAEAAGCDKKSAECLPDLDFVDVQGQVFTPETYEGKVVMVNFWATWCNPCKIEVPHLTRAYQKYKDQGFVLFGVMTDDADGNLDAFEKFKATYKLNYPVIPADVPIMEHWNYPPNLPTTFIYDRHGKLHTTKTGILREADLERILPELLADEPAAAPAD
jgi:thiol-disulfide isomerase/thioredoxin